MKSSAIMLSLVCVLATSASAQTSRSSSYGAPVLVAPQPNCYTMGQFLIDQQEAISKQLDNQLKSARYFFEKQKINLQSKTELVQQTAELKKAKIAAYEARCDAGLAYQESRVARQLALQSKAEEARKLAAVKIDLGKRLAWPLALRRPELGDKRAELESAIHRLTHYTSTSGAEGIVEVQQRTAELYSQLRELRNDQQVLFEDLVAAKKYLNGVELAAENFVAPSHVERLASKD